MSTENIPIPTQKIFVESNEEIVFTLEKIRKSEHGRILLIIPNHATITSSLINLKLLSRQLCDTSKDAVLITNSEIALNKSDETHLLAFQKVEEVNPTVWEQAHNLIEELREKRNQIKNKLISARTESTQSPIIQDLDFEAEEDYLTQPEESVGPPPSPPFEKIEYQEEEPEVTIEPPKIVFEPKLRKIGNFEILAGADMTLHEYQYIFSAKTENQISVVPEAVDMDPTSKKKADYLGLVGKNINRIEKIHDTPSLQAPKPSIGEHRTQSLANPKVPWSQQLKSPKILSGIFVVLLIALYLLVSYNLRTAVINITAKPRSETISSRITASSSVFSTNLQDKTIPLSKVILTKSGSDTADATEQGKVGEKATGVADITNKTDKEVKLKAGTSIVTLSKNLKFELTKDIAIPARKGETSFSTYEDAPIVASEPGSEYNIDSADIKIAEYNTSTELSGRIYNPTTGGESKDATVVSQKDVDDLKKKLETSLQDTLKNEMDQKIKDDQILIPGTEKFSEKSFELSKQIGEEAKQFDITKLEVEYSVLVISKSDLDKITQEMVEDEFGKDTISVDKKIEVKDIKIENEEEVKVNVSKSVSLVSEVLPKDIHPLIKGKSPDEASQIIKLEYPEVESVEISYEPAFVFPLFRSIPSDAESIKIDIITTKNN